MIKLINVSKYFVTPFGRHYVFRDVNIELPLDRNVGVIGPNGAGKSTFLRLLAGADHPSSGTIVKTGRISPPMGLTPVLQGSLSALENVKFAGRIYGMTKHEIDGMIGFVRDLAKIGHYFEMPVNTYSAGMRQKVAFGINMSMQFDYYLFDEISAGGDREFRKMARAMVAERLRTSRFVMTSHDTSELLELCDAGIVIKDGVLTYFEDVREAAIFYGDDVDGGSERRSRKTKRARAAADAGDSGASLEAADRKRAKREKKKAHRAKRKSAQVVPTVSVLASPPSSLPAPPVLPVDDVDIPGPTADAEQGAKQASQPRRQKRGRRHLDIDAGGAEVKVVAKQRRARRHSIAPARSTVADVNSGNDQAAAAGAPSTRRLAAPAAPVSSTVRVAHRSACAVSVLDGGETAGSHHERSRGT